MSNKRRAVLLEPSLFLRVGHVFDSLNLFSEFLKSADVYFLVPKDCPYTDLDLKSGHFVNILPNSYSAYHIPARAYNIKNRILFRLSSFLIFPRKYRISFENYFFRAIIFIRDYRKIKRSLERFFSEMKLSANDIVILPNADLLFTFALLSYSVKSKSQFTISLRFINVMENINLRPLINLERLLRRIAIYRSRGLKVKVAGESDRYVNWMSYFCENIQVVPLPLRIISKNVTRRDNSNYETIGFIGSARPDKGLDKVPGIMKEIIYRNSKNVRFIVQEATETWGNQYEDALSKIKKFPNVVLIPGEISRLNFSKYVNMCSIFILPYDQMTYKFRSSAIFFEAMDRAIPVVAPSNTGFGETVRKFGLGVTYSSIEEIPSILTQISSNSFIKQFQNNCREFNSIRKMKTLWFVSSTEIGE